MDAVLNLLFNHPVGLLSLVALLLVVVLSVAVHLWLRRKMNAHEE